MRMMTTGFLLASPLVSAFCYTITRVIKGYRDVVFAGA
ncbi:hypothetical protein APHNP_0574 [Anaplasma phagocytophilum str. ApNP]|nr:hypothetical protein APHNP_0574 [Anaplasma phagocytophilum str. ApNP]